MKNVSSCACAFAFAATAAIALTACSSGGSTGTPPALNAAADAQNSSRSIPAFNIPNRLPRELAYVSEPVTSIINVYNQSTAALQYTLTSANGLASPQGLFVDHLQRLWVANEDAQNILVFPRGQTTATIILNDPNADALDVTVCANGTAYVANQEDAAVGSGDIVYYYPGSTTPDGHLVYPGQGQNFGLTCTPGGDVYTTLVDGAGTGRVVKYPGGAQAGATQLPIAMAGLLLGGIKRDNAGKLVVNDRQAHTVREFTLSGVQTNQIGTGNGDWSGIALTRNGSTILGADDVQHVGRRRALWSGTLLSPPYTSLPSFGRPVGAAFDPGQAGLG